MRTLITAPPEDILAALWAAAPAIHHLLASSRSLQHARNRLFDHLNALERHYFNIYADTPFKHIHIAEKHIAKECIRVMKNIIRSENEQITGASALALLRQLARQPARAVARVSPGFLCEFLHLFNGIYGRSGTLQRVSEHQPDAGTAAAAQRRSRQLDQYAQAADAAMRRYHSGLEPALVRRSAVMRRRVLRFFGASPRAWRDPHWQLAHVIRDARTLRALVRLEPDELDGLAAAKEYGIPVHITPHYVTLFNPDGRDDTDRAVRAQVIPSATYCRTVAANRAQGVDLDFMGERSTSPIAGITRRYPNIVILKPYDACPQICVYCQRNWEIKSLDEARVTRPAVRAALQWIARHPGITEVLITGGDPLTLDDQYLRWMLDTLAAIPHVDRVRIGTRTLVTMPQRFTPALVRLLARHHVLGRREVCIMTHVESPRELTPDVLAAVRALRGAGLSMYNQQVFTYYTSRRFETAFLRRMLKRCGIDPYYTFNTKGKDETLDFRVPIARIEQERKEEARQLPGLVRTDEPVFNVPRIGKSHLRSWQDHEPLMILPDGRRVYRFFPWESRLRTVEDYIYTDVSIYDYLKRLHADGENVDDYHSIWYYF